MRKRSLWIIGIALINPLGGCRPGSNAHISPVAERGAPPGLARHPTSSPTTEDVAQPPVAEFRQHLADNGSITFRSFNGKAYRMDCDLEMTFFPDGSAHVFDYGLSLEGHTGSYRVEPEGRITAEFTRFSDGHMAMILQRDTNSLLLKPADHHTRYVMGNDPNEFWPFRPIDGDDEREVLRRVRQDLSPSKWDPRPRG